MNFSDLQMSNGDIAAGSLPRGKALRPLHGMLALVMSLAVWSAPPARAQMPASAPEESAGKTSGNYNVQESIEFGYRDSLVSGNLNNYLTFDNLSSGVRLFDYTMNMRSINHQGILFDNLSFSNFGYGGDPNEVSRLRIEKNKWYDFRAVYRRDKNIWNYNLLGNPLNPASATIAGAAIANSPHAEYLSRHMMDYDLKILPQSRLTFRLGYSRNTNSGPAYTSLEGGTDTVLLQNDRYTTNAYRAGVDYKGISKTTLSFDEFLTYSKIDNSATDANLGYQLANGTPVDLGIVFVGTTPCATPISNAATSPPTVTSNCSGYLSYSQVQNPRSSFPTERFSFESTYIKNLSMSGSMGYSGGTNTLSNFAESVNGWASRTVTRGSTTGGPAQAQRVSVNANWTGDYRLTDNLNLVDEFSYDNWRSPSMWATAETNLFATAPTSGQTGLLLPISTVTPATFATLCPTAPYNSPGCPQHNASSLADVTNEIVSQFLGQNIRSNTIELKYDITRRVSAHVGYLFMARTIADFSATFDVGEIYLPGGAAGNLGNHYLAARADCAVVAGALPAACTVNANGSIQEGSLTNPIPDAGNDAARNIYEIHENAALLGVAARPTDKLRFNADVMFSYNDNSFTRTSPRQVQSYKISVHYAPTPWSTVEGTVDINENRDNVATINNLEHSRNYSFVTTLAPNSKLYVDFGFNYMDIYTQTEICFPDTGSTIFTTPCPIAGATSPLGTLSSYASQDYYAYGDMMWKPHKRVTAMLGYGGSIVRGNTTFLNLLTPTEPLDFNYIKPYASLAIDLYRGLAYKTAWNYFGYNDHGIANPAGLATLPSQNFDGNNITFSFRYSF